jgi:hypothetical protein
MGVSVIGIAETTMLLNVATQTLFRTNPYEFLVGNNSYMTAGGTSSMSLKELFKTNQHSSGAANYETMEVIKSNFKAQWFSGALQMALIPIGFKFGKQLARPAISRTNRLLNKSGIGSTLKL